MNKFTVFYNDGTQFSGDPLTLDWIKIPITKQIIQLRYLLGNQFVMMEGFKEYNHCKENIGLQARGIAKFLLMGREKNRTLIITFDLIKKKIYKEYKKYGEEYGKQKLYGWKNGKLNNPKAYFKKIDNLKT